MEEDFIETFSSLADQIKTLPDLQIELYRVHPEYLVTDVREHVAGTDNPQPAGELEQLLDLSSPLLLVRQITISSELDGAAGGLSSLGIRNHFYLQNKTELNIIVLTLKIVPWHSPLD